MLMNAGRPFSKRAVGCLGALVFLVVGMFFVGGASYLIDCAFNPWAHSPTGRPTLVGSWVGRVTSPSGQARALFLEMHRSTTSRGGYSTCHTCPRIEGTAKLCGSEADVRPHDVWGGPDSWDGSRFHLQVATAKGQQPRPGLQAGSMRGAWSGDALDMSMLFRFYNERGAGVYASDNPDVNVPAKFAMARGGETDFLAECRKLGAGAGK
jgi:hypothetical protein